MRRLPFAPLVPFLLSLLGCGDDVTAPDGGPAADSGQDGSADASPDGDRRRSCTLPELRFERDLVGAEPGVTRRVLLTLDRDSTCGDANIALETSMSGVVSVPDTASIPDTTSETVVPITAERPGEVTLTARWEHADDVSTATMRFMVTDGTVPSCDGEAAGDLHYGERLTLDNGGADAQLGLPAGAEDRDAYFVAPFSASIACAEDQLPDDYVALGPAVTFGPEHRRFPREMPVAIPIKLALLAEGARRRHVEVAYTGPGVATPRIIPVASPYFEGTPAMGSLHFQTPRLGTYQAVVRRDAPVERDRTFTFRGITGVSMGSGGAGLIGLRHPERFDFVAPLGGPVDWIYMHHYIRTYHLGGFCTEEERLASPDLCAAGADTSRTPPATELHEVRQDFEHWYYDEAIGGQGGTFGRSDYLSLFRDVTRMYGNPLSDRTPDANEPSITPPGIPDERRDLSDTERCENPVIIPPCEGTFPDCAPGTGYADDEYNPEGQHPVITFCDGSNLRVGGEVDTGVWDPFGANRTPLEVSLAVDIDGDALRDPGEPVLRGGLEPFEDCGLDRVCNEDEPGYDAVTNPDPNGDDYDYQFHPNGTEGNWLRDSADGDPCSDDGERFSDSGLDGVAGTRSLDEGGFDRGEGNGCWDVARGLSRMIARNPRSLLRSQPRDAIRDLDIFTDGGIRDLFNFAVAHNHFVGSLPGRGFPLTLFNAHADLDLEPPLPEERLDIAEVDWRQVGKYAIVRYGDPDASPMEKLEGDGAHVGTPPQLIDRLLSVLAWMSARWPGGDRARVRDQICTPSSTGCDNPNQFTFDFTSEAAGRTGPVAVILPPGYFDEEYADERYPVVYFGHGYGQEPEDLTATGIIIRSLMVANTIPTERRLQKMILVFPDGRCNEDECIQGTFYTDAPESNPEGAQAETFVLDLMDYMDENFRTKAAETLPVLE